jgi:hypothetical protein
MTEAVKIILAHGSVVHGGYVRDLIAGVPFTDIDVIASPEFTTYLKENNIEIIEKQNTVGYANNVLHATAEFMGHHLDLMILKDGNVAPVSGTFFTEDFECNSLYMYGDDTYRTRSDSSVARIIEQIKCRLAVPTNDHQLLYKTILRYIDRSYKMYMKGYTLAGSVKFISAIGHKWHKMQYRDIVYDRYVLQGLVDRSADLSKSGYSYVDQLGTVHDVESIENPHFVRK